MPKPAGATAPVPAPAKPAAAPKTAAAATAKETTVSKRKPAADKDASPAPKKAKAEAAPAAAAAAASSVPPAPPAPPAGVPPPPAPASGKKPSTAKDGSTKSHVNLTRVVRLLFSRRVLRTGARACVLTRAVSLPTSNTARPSRWRIRRACASLKPSCRPSTRPRSPTPTRLRALAPRRRCCARARTDTPTVGSNEQSQMLIADGVHELDKGDPKGYFWDDYYKDWKISIRVRFLLVAALDCG